MHSPDDSLSITELSAVVRELQRRLGALTAEYKQASLLLSEKNVAAQNACNVFLKQVEDQTQPSAEREAWEALTEDEREVVIAALKRGDDPVPLLAATVKES